MSKASSKNGIYVVDFFDVYSRHAYVLPKLRNNRFRLFIRKMKPFILSDPGMRIRRMNRGTDRMPLAIIFGKGGLELEIKVHVRNCCIKYIQFFENPREK